MLGDEQIFLIGSVVSFISLAGAYVYLRAEFQRRTVKRHAAARGAPTASTRMAPPGW